MTKRVRLVVSVILIPTVISFSSPVNSMSVQSVKPVSQEDLEVSNLQIVESLEENSEESLTEESLFDERVRGTPLSNDLKVFIKEASEYYGFDEYLIYQIIYCESRLNPRTVSSAQCYGLMQVNKKYSKSYLSWSDEFSSQISDDLTDPKTSIVLGLRTLSDWRRMINSEDIVKILNCYNAGWAGKKYKGPSNYTKKVLSIKLEVLDFSSYEVVGSDS